MLTKNYDDHTDYELSWEELQAVLKHKYYHDEYEGYWGRGYIHELKCTVCGNVFYAKYPYAKYCSYTCKIDTYIERRRQRTKPKYWEGPCQYCGNKFNSHRVDAKYCCDSHRVLACLERRKKELSVTGGA